MSARATGISTSTASATLYGLAALHAVWATGSPWPLSDRESLADAAAGRGSSPSPSACLTVAGLLAAGGALVSGRPRNAPGVSRAGTAGVVATFALRGGLGLAGRTDLVSSGSTSDRFRRLDRRWYSPLCVAIAVLASPGIRRRVRRAGGG